MGLMRIVVVVVVRVRSGEERQQGKERRCRGCAAGGDAFHDEQLVMGKTTSFGPLAWVKQRVILKPLGVDQKEMVVIKSAMS